ncbi:MAG: hypothetical protein WBP93_00970, partial [Pyrinomonadaceae bacterium]
TKPRAEKFSATTESGTPEESLSEPPSPNQPPELAPVRYKRVHLDQRVVFGLDVIDEESDDVRVELIEKPKSARYNEKTLTVEWFPKEADGRVGRFSVRITEYERGTGKELSSQLKRINIPISTGYVEEPTVPRAPLPVETLISITDIERLAAARERFPIITMFNRIAEIEAAKQIKAGTDAQPTTGAALFHDAMKNLAALHHNDDIDPDSPHFNRQWDQSNWHIVMVRPRVNKKIFELRLVYRNDSAPEPVYLMPRIRIVRGTDADILKDNDLRQKNNEAFARLFHDAFFDGPNLKPFVATDKGKYGAALADFIARVLNYKDPTEPRMQTNFAALPHNGRMGGDDTLDANGKYLRGNGWALGVMKVVPVPRNDKMVLAFANLPIDGFATSIKPAPDGKSYKPTPAPRFDPNSPMRIQDLDRLIDSLGFAGIPDEREFSGVKATDIDASSISRVFKERYMVEETPLKDPRRRLFEERGMTCIQCHVRNFDEGDYLDAAVADPQRKGMMPARTIPRLFFVITPDEGRSEFFRRNEAEQVGNLKGVMRDYLKVNINLPSPLGPTWPFNTRTGRS